MLITIVTEASSQCALPSRVAKYCSEPRPELLDESAASHLVEAQLVPATPS